MIFMGPYFILLWCYAHIKINSLQSVQYPFLIILLIIVISIFYSNLSVVNCDYILKYSTERANPQHYYTLAS